jgi:hypothetical protein
MSGPDVAEAQGKLNEAGASPQLDTDGQFGPKTRTAVFAFQDANELTVDGIVGPQTWDALDAVGTPACGECEEGDTEDVLIGPEAAFAEGVPGGLGGGLMEELGGPGGGPNLTVQATSDERATPGALIQRQPASCPVCTKKKPVKVVPAGPPTDFANFRCETKQKVKIELFTGMMNDAIATQILRARLLLLAHNLDLDVDIKSVSPRLFPKGFDVNLGGDDGDGALQNKFDLCKVVAATVKDVGHDAGRLPVFFVPAGEGLMGGEDGSTGEHFPDLESTCAGLNETAGGLSSVVVINVRVQCSDLGTLLHEIGHGAGDVHEEKTYMAGVCGAEGRATMLHNQVRKLCNVSFP